MTTDLMQNKAGSKKPQCQNPSQNKHLQFNCRKHTAQKLVPTTYLKILFPTKLLSKEFPRRYQRMVRKSQASLIAQLSEACPGQ